MEKPVYSTIHTKFGNFVITVWPEKKGLEPIVLSTPKLNFKKPVLVRIHSECMPSDTFYSLDCDCGEQKEKALKMINKSRNGVFVYLRHEGMGVGLFNKVKIYKLQEKGYDMLEARKKLGFKSDDRDYSIAKVMLKSLGINRINLITNNPSKIAEMRKLGFVVEKRIPIKIRANRYNAKHLETKKNKYGNLI